MRTRLRWRRRCARWAPRPRGRGSLKQLAMTKPRGPTERTELRLTRPLRSARASGRTICDGRCGRLRLVDPNTTCSSSTTRRERPHPSGGRSDSARSLCLRTDARSERRAQSRDARSHRRRSSHSPTTTRRRSRNGSAQLVRNFRDSRVQCATGLTLPIRARNRGPGAVRERIAVRTRLSPAHLRRAARQPGGRRTGRRRCEHGAARKLVRRSGRSTSGSTPARRRDRAAITRCSFACWPRAPGSSTTRRRSAGTGIGGPTRKSSTRCTATASACTRCGTGLLSSARARDGPPGVGLVPRRAPAGAAAHVAASAADHSQRAGAGRTSRLPARASGVVCIEAAAHGSWGPLMPALTVVVPTAQSARVGRTLA